MIKGVPTGEVCVCVVVVVVGGGDGGCNTPHFLEICIQSCRKLLPAMPLLKKLYKICTDDYDNNEYLAVNNIRFFTNDIICL